MVISKKGTNPNDFTFQDQQSPSRNTDMEQPANNNQEDLLEALSKK